MRNFNEIEIVTNKDELSFCKYIERLQELMRDCSREEYLSEIFMPFLRMCCTDNSKIIPVFDDRKCGKQTENETEFSERMKKICAMREDGESYVVPDYIFVHNDYTYKNPRKPYFMVETKMPTILKEGERYRPLKDKISENEEQLKVEINSCGIVIFTDGYTWMFLELDDSGKIVNKHDSICLLKLGNKYYSTFNAEIKKEIREVDLSVIGLGIVDIEDEPIEWEQLKTLIYQLIEEKENAEQNTKIE